MDTPETRVSLSEPEVAVKRQHLSSAVKRHEPA